MSDSSVDWESPPPPLAPSNRSQTGVWLSWLVILVCALVMILRDRAAVTREAMQTNQILHGGIDEGDTTPEAALTRLSQTMLARYAVGLKVVETAIAAPNKKDDLKKTQLRMDTDAESPAGHMRAAILAGELLGTREALDRLDALTHGPPLTPQQHATADLLKKVYTDTPAALTDQERGQLHDSGWFGQLALSVGLSPTDPQRRGAVEPAMRAFVASIVILLVAGALLLVGVALLIVVLVLEMKGRWQWRFVPANRLVGGRALETVAAWFAIFVVIALIGGVVLRRWGYDIRIAAYALLLLVPLWPLARGVDWATWRQAVGWHGGRGFFREIGAGLAGYIAGTPILLAGALITMLLTKLTGQRPVHPLVFEILQGGWPRIVEMFVLAAIWAPLLEETIFRGALYQHLRGWSAPIAAAMMSGFIFAAIHPQGFAGIPPLMALGFTFAMIREWRGSLIGPMVAHAMNNGTVVVLLVLVMR